MVAILICDDDPDIRAAMKRTLRGYVVTETTSPREAIEALKGGTFDAIISDFSLEADRDGLDLLQHARVSCPDMIRFLVTGNREIEVAARAINEGAVHRFFSKPWDDEKLRAALEILLRSRHSSGST
ncbi:MAG: response regulator [Myxococcota bacterium]|nr:response regulator [Deltaproteobacteria bacterium]MDQ3338611.1 response regulator [Myxococcota bacterium]